MKEEINNDNLDNTIHMSHYYSKYVAFKNHLEDGDTFMSYLDKLIESKNKKLVKLPYNQDEFVDFLYHIAKEDDFIDIFKKMNILYVNALSKKYIINKKYDSVFKNLETKLDYACSRIFTLMNFGKTIDNVKQQPLPKSLTIPFIQFLQDINPKENINDYLIGDFRYKFVPYSLELLNTNNKEDWTSLLGLSKEEGTNICIEYFSNFFVHLLTDTLLLKSNFNNLKEKVELLQEYKEAYPAQFEKDRLQFEEGMEKLGIQEIYNADISKIRYFFKIKSFEEKQPLNPFLNKPKKNKI